MRRCAKLDLDVDPDMSMVSRSAYSANLTKGSLKPVETRRLARLLQDGLSESEVLSRVVAENLLQKRAPSTSRTLGAYLLKRLAACPGCVVEVVATGSHRECVQGSLVAALAESRLLRSFFEHTVAEARASGRGYLSASDWSSFFDWLESVDPEVARWTPPVRSKLRQNIWRILAEAEMVESTRTLRLQALRLEAAIRKCLADPRLGGVERALSAAGVA